MSEWSNVPVLKTGEGYTSGGSNPPLPAIQIQTPQTATTTDFYQIQIHYQATFMILIEKSMILP